MIGNTLSLGTGTDGLQKVSAHVLLAEPDWVQETMSRLLTGSTAVGRLARCRLICS